MAKVRFAAVSDADIEDLLREMRAADRAECEAYGTGTIEEGVRASVAESTVCWSARDEDGLVCIFGVGPVGDEIGDVGSPWMLGTHRLLRHQKELMRTVPDFLIEMRWHFPKLMNFVHVGNTTSIRWLQRLGFDVFEPVRHGLRGELFHPFLMGF